ncbi:MAG: arsenite efflux transporter metallochaperone ArsD [Planctomycetota bacterium]|nr:arsenite efflux transporter metallochaperone ArsD [Planctomycetota bacterium]
MQRLEVFDPPMCCSSGVCGPSVDKRLVRFSAALDWLKSQGVEVARYSPTQQYDAFVSNLIVVETVNELGSDCLPLILVNGEVVSMGGYPERVELAAMASVEREGLV